MAVREDIVEEIDIPPGLIARARRTARKACKDDLQRTRSDHEFDEQRFCGRVGEEVLRVWAEKHGITLAEAEAGAPHDAVMLTDDAVRVEVKARNLDEYGPSDPQDDVIIRCRDKSLWRDDIADREAIDRSLKSDLYVFVCFSEDEETAEVRGWTTRHRVRDDADWCPGLSPDDTTWDGGDRDMPPARRVLGTDLVTLETALGLLNAYRALEKQH